MHGRQRQDHKLVHPFQTGRWGNARRYTKSHGKISLTKHLRREKSLYREPDGVPERTSRIKLVLREWQGDAPPIFRGRTLARREIRKHRWWERGRRESRGRVGHGTLDTSPNLSLEMQGEGAPASGNHKKQTWEDRLKLVRTGGRSAHSQSTARGAGQKTPCRKDKT